MTAALAVPLDAVTPRHSFDPLYQAAGEEFLANTFGNDWREHWPELREAAAFTPVDQAWVDKRTARLLLWADEDAVVRLIPQHIWHLGTALMQRGDGWFAVWCELARRTPRQWLVQFCGVAMARSDGKLRTLDNHRAKSMLVAGVLAWQLAEYDPEGDPDFPFVIRGLPYGSWLQLLSYWEQRSDGVHHRVPSASTVFGLHRGAGDPMCGECGYIAAFKVAGIAYSVQPPAFTLEAGLRGKWRKNKYDEWEVWAFHELRLRIPVRPDEVLPMGPPPPWWVGKPRKRPALADVIDLTAEIEAAERDWFPDPEEVGATAEAPPSALPPSIDVPEGAVTTFADVDMSMPAWLAPPSETAGEGRAGIVQGASAERYLSIIAQYVEPDATSLTPTTYGAGNLTVRRAQEHAPPSPRLRKALERFEAAASARVRAPPVDPPD